MLPAPPTSLRVEATAHETRILLDHGRPLAPLARVKRPVVVVWLLCVLISWFVPFLYCWLGPLATLAMAVVLMLDASRTVAHSIVLRADALVLITRDLVTLHRHEIPWPTLVEAALDGAEPDPPRALWLRWQTPEGPASFRLGIGRPATELGWLRDVLQAVHARALDDAVSDAQVVPG